MIKKFKQMKEWFKRKTLLSEIQADTKASGERHEKEEKEELIAKMEALKKENRDLKKSFEKKERELLKLQAEKSGLQLKESKLELDLVILQDKNDELKEQLESKDTQITNSLEKIKILEKEVEQLKNPHEIEKEQEKVSFQPLVEKVEEYKEELENSNRKKGSIKTIEKYSAPGILKEKITIDKGELTYQGEENDFGTQEYLYPIHSVETEKYNENGELTYSCYKDMVHETYSLEKYYQDGQLEKLIEKGCKHSDTDMLIEEHYKNGELQRSLNYKDWSHREETINEGGPLYKTSYHRFNQELSVTKHINNEIISTKNYDIRDKKVDFTKPIDLSKYQEITAEKEQPKEKPKIFIPKYKGKDNEMER